MKKTLFTIIVGLFFTSVVNGETRWHDNTTISKVYPQAHGGFILTFSTNNPYCTDANSPEQYFRVEVGQNGVTQEGLMLIYSAALTAAATNKQVIAIFDDRTSQCYINRLVVDF